MLRSYLVAGPFSRSLETQSRAQWGYWNSVVDMVVDTAL